MTSKNILSFFNALIIHYRKVDLKYKDTPYYKEEDIVKLFMEYQSIEKVFESIVLKFEKDVVVDDEYIDGVFKEFKIDREEANKVLRQMSQPKEPSFSRKALAKKPSFTKKDLSNTDESEQNTVKAKTEEFPKKSNKDISNNIKNQYPEKSNVSKKVILLISLISIIIFVFLQPSNNSSNSKDSYTSCTKPDNSGGYLSKVVSRIENNNCGIQYYFFKGDGIYIVGAICPSYGGSKEFEILVNECGEIQVVI